MENQVAQAEAMVVSHRTLAFVLAVILGIVLLGCALGGYEWVQAHDRAILAEASNKAQAQMLSAKQAASEQDQKADADLKIQLDVQQKQNASMQAALTTASAAIANQRHAATTPAEIQALIAAQTGLKTQTVLNPANPVTGVPAQQLAELPASALADYTTACTECKATAASLTVQNSNLTSQIAALGTINSNLKDINTNGQAELKAMTVERDNWKVAAKGVWWKTALKDAGFIAVSGLSGYAIGKTTTRTTSTGLAARRYAH